jgi:hypothetical protein
MLGTRRKRLLAAVEFAGGANHRRSLALNAHSYRLLNLIGRGSALFAIGPTARLMRLDAEAGRRWNRFCASC